MNCSILKDLHFLGFKMKVFEKFLSPSQQYRESTQERLRKNLQSEINKIEKSLIETNNFAELNEATLLFSRNQLNEKINGAEEAFKILGEMTQYFENPMHSSDAFELTKDMHFDTKKITAIFSS